MSSCHSGIAYYPVYTTLISGVNIPYNQGYRPDVASYISEVCSKRSEASAEEKVREAITQTLFRESEAQTDPFDAEPKQTIGLEVVTLGWLSWNNGLPAGMREAVIIERARQKRAWERALPMPVDPVTKRLKDMILEAIELNEWNYREAELAALNSIRLEMAQACMERHLSANRMKYESRLHRYICSKSDEKVAAINKIRSKLKRDIRKLTYERKNVNRKYHSWNILRQLDDKTSEYYGPQMRFGVDPRRRHEVIPPQFRYWEKFSNFDVISSKLPPFQVVGWKRIQSFDYEEKSKPTKKYKELCIKETKWSLRKLEELYDILRSIRRHRTYAKVKKPCKLKVFIEPPPKAFSPPSVEGVSQEEEDLHQSSLTLQKAIKGRAIQMVMYEGRVKCQELIEELKSTHALQTYMEDIKKGARQKVCQQQRNVEVKLLEEKKKSEVLRSLEGKTVSEILDFLSKELVRLQNERVTHAFALMADRMRHDREAAEGGRRQAEEQRRREHEEMWKQISKVYQNSVDVMMADVADEEKRKFAARYGRMKAEEYARRIDQAAQEAVLKKSEIYDTEIVADLVYNFALPEAEKEIIRKRVQDRQKTMLGACHDEIYTKIEEVSVGPRTGSGVLLPISRPQRHVVPPPHYIKFLKLKRASASPHSSLEASDFSSQENLMATPR